MMRTANVFFDKPVWAMDGEIGRLSDFYFDEGSWQIRYLAVEGSGDSESNTVLVSSEAFASFDGDRLKLRLTKEEILRCRDKSYSHEMHSPETHEIFYKSEPSLDGFNSRFRIVLFPPSSSTGGKGNGKAEELNCRSGRRISEFKIMAEDMTTAEAEDFLFDDRLWNIRFLLFRRSGGSVRDINLLGSFLVEKIEWGQGIVYVACGDRYLSRCPRFDPEVFSNVSYEEFLAQYNATARKRASPHGDVN